MARGWVSVKLAMNAAHHGHAKFRFSPHRECPTHVPPISVVLNVIFQESASSPVRSPPFGIGPQGVTIRPRPGRSGFREELRIQDPGYTASNFAATISGLSVVVCPYWVMDGLKLVKVPVDTATPAIFIVVESV